VALAALLALTLPSAVAVADEPPPQLKPVRVVVLVDESGSLSKQDIERERDAARVIVQGEPSAGSTVSVVGFASANARGQTPVDPVCPPTKVDTPQNRQFLADCVGKLRPRTPQEGDDTDHLNALRQALSYLDVPGAGNQPKIVFLLTDGMLNVSNSPSYGRNLSPGERNAAARQQIPEVLGELGRAGVQVWPLGFGNVDRRQLEGFATGAAQRRCGVSTPEPSASVISGSADLLRAIAVASSAARCATVGDPVRGELVPGGSIDLAVDVPPIASEGVILVFKRDPRVAVEYLDPDGTRVPVNGTLGSSRFGVSGQNSEAEALRVVNPVPGEWTVRLSSPPGLRRLDVAAVVVFQGAVRAAIAASPPAPAAGARVGITMQVRGVRSAITDPEQLRGLTFVAGLTGDGFAPKPPVELADPDGDGQYTGQISVPRTANGRLNFVGSVTGIGVSGDERTFATRVAPGVGGLQGVLSLNDTAPEVVRGSALGGTAEVTNSSGQQRTLRIEVSDPGPGTVVSVEPAQLRVPAAGNAKLPFTVRFDRSTALGPNQARLRLVDSAGGPSVGELLISRDIVTPPGFLAKFWWLLALIALLAVGATLIFLRWLRNRPLPADDLRGVRIELRRLGQVVSSLTVHGSTKEFHFGLIAVPDQGLALTAGADGQRYRVRRNRNGPVLHGPGGSYPMPAAPLDLGNGFQLAVLDRLAVTRLAGAYSAPAPPRQRPQFDPYDNT
jgi:hypothetical protein